MAVHDLTGGKVAVNASIKPSLQLLQEHLERRKPLWAKLTEEQKIKLIRSKRDPVLDIAWTILQYLCDEDLFNVDLRKEKINGDI